MKASLIIWWLFIGLVLNAQNCLHIQFHGEPAIGGYQYNRDTLIFPYKAANTSTYNAVGILNLNTDKWSVTSYSSAFSFSNTNISNFVMKNLNEGICATTANQLAFSTSNFWQTTSPLTGTVNGLGATKFGYYGYRNPAGCGQCTYSLVFSANGSTWTNVLIEANSFNPPVFAKSKTKLYTLHNNLLKASTNGGASYTTVSGTYTFNVAFPVVPKILTLNDDTIFVLANQFHRSFDGGVTWSTIAAPTASFSIGQVAARNAKQLLIIDKLSPYNIYYSGNSGTSWTTYTTLPQFASGSDRLIANDNFFYLSPQHKSTTGLVWQDFLPAAPTLMPYDISFTGNVGLVGSAQGRFGYTTNRGYNYNFLPNKIPSNEDVMTVKAVDVGKFLVCDRKGQIFVSTNQGITWAQKNTSTFNTIPRKFTISTDKNTIVCTYLSNFMRSIDGGATFSNVAVSGGGNHSQTIIPSTGAVINVGGSFLAPSFTLAAWEISNISNSNIKTILSTIPVNNGAEAIIDIQMRDDLVGYFVTRRVATFETIIRKTTDGWATTSLVATIPTPTVGTIAYDALYGKIQTFGADTVIISGSGNPVNNQTNFYHISTNGGSTWNAVYTNFNKPIHPLGNRVYKMDFFNANEYMALISGNLSGGPSASIGVFLGAAGNGGGAGNIGINELSFKNNTGFMKVYPNPTHDKLNIELNRFENEVKQLLFFISDVLGNVVITSTIDNQDTAINTSTLKEGLYFLTIKAEGNVYSAKFIKN